MLEWRKRRSLTSIRERHLLRIDTDSSEKSALLYIWRAVYRFPGLVFKDYSSLCFSALFLRCYYAARHLSLLGYVIIAARRLSWWLAVSKASPAYSSPGYFQQLLFACTWQTVVVLFLINVEWLSSPRIDSTRFRFPCLKIQTPCDTLMLKKAALTP